MRNALRLLVACTLIAPLTASAEQATGQLNVTAKVQKSCAVTVPATGLEFAYDPISGSGADSSVALTIVCTKNLGAKIAITAGTSGDVAARAMSNGAGGTLNYQLFRDAGRTLPWGDTIDVNTLDYTGAGKVATPSTVTVYGRILDSNVNGAAFGSDYTDQVDVVINY